MLFANLHLLRPWWLLALVPLVLLSWRLWRYAQAYGSWQQVCDAHLLPYLIERSQQPFHKGLIFGLMLAWSLAVLALAGPSWERIPTAVYRAEQARIILLDLSAAMDAADIKPSRLARARYKILDILKASQEAQIGLIAFSGEPYVVSPLTQDAKTIAAIVPVLATSLMPVTGHNIGAALDKARDLFKQAQVTEGQIILITASQPTAADLAIAKKLCQQGYATSVLGVGTAAGAPIPTSISADQPPEMAKLTMADLQRLASAGGGRFEAFSNNERDINNILTAVQATSGAKQTNEAVAIWRDDGFWLIIPLLFLVALAFRRGWFTELTR